MKHWFTLLAISMITFMNTLDASIVNVAMPQLSRQLHVPMNQAEWLVSVYLVLICILLLFWGRLSDQIGSVRLFQAGSLCFLAGSLMCALSPNFWLLFTGRIVQAIGASMTMSTNFGLIAKLFPMTEHGRAFGLNSVIAQLGNISGPGLGGLLLGHLSWHWLFLINLPVGLIIYLYGRRVLPNDRQYLTPSIDWLGFASYAVTTASFFIAIYWGQAAGFATPGVLILMAIALGFLVGFIAIEHRVAQPMIRLSLFKAPRFSLGLISALMVYAVGYFANVALPFYFQETLAFSATGAGLLLMLIPIANMIAAPVSGQFVDRFNPVSVSVIGLIIYAVPVLYLTWLPNPPIFWQLVLVLMALGVGNGTFQNNPMIMDAAPPEAQGVAGSIAALFRNLGMAVGLSLATTTLYWGMQRQAGRPVTHYPQGHPDWFLTGMRYSYWYAVGLIFFALILIGGLYWRQRRNET
ncbi:MFS transporter [uncultured Secundilactobacillus sp.]|uniref:MFS transporter n=1 Tax=uncultured Secundilactobacillus sp. TaxID=2813935 RepID=UPI00258567A6|nr:MFS transporter [uncultured Secundilactobacillus sp.]